MKATTTKIDLGDTCRPGNPRRMKMKTTTAEAIAEIMAAWNAIEQGVRASMPGASEDDIYLAAKAAMDAAIAKN